MYLNGWRLGYRPALDGLRGIAILLVVGQHALLPGFRNAGYVGVTMFFVLSGFLITRLLLEEHEAHGRVDLARFYLRRARRLFPALAVLLVAVAAFMYGTGHPDEIVADTIPVVFYYANWVHATSEPLGLLGHAWSLAIEEQFYLLWPAALLLLLPRVAPQRMLAFLLGVAIISAVLRGIVLPTLGPQAALRLTFTQADGLLVGCALAVVFGRRTVDPGWRWVVAAVIGLAWAASSADYDTFIVLGLPVTVAASAVVTAKASTSGGGILSWRPLIWIGTISYGLYLWHAPVLRIGRDTGWLPGPAAIPLIAVAILLAVLSWRYVERPFRNARGSPAQLEQVQRPVADEPQRASATS